MTAEMRQSILNDLQDAKEWAGVLQGNWFLQMWFQNTVNADGSFPDFTGKEKSFMLQQRVLRCHVYDHRWRLFYTKDELEFLLHNKNQLLLPRVHRRLYIKNQLHLIKPHRLFPFATEKTADI